jgi:alanyl aminopeptidase
MRLREVALPFAADIGEDSALAREARELAQRWLTDRRAVPPQVRQIVLATAARTARADAAQLFDSLLVVAKATKDQNERDQVLAALAQFRDPALVRRALDAALDPALHPRDGSTILLGALVHARSRAAALAWLGQNIAALAARLPREQQAYWPLWASGVCTTAERASVVAIFAPRAAAVDGGVRAYRQALERIDLCLAMRAAQEAPLNAFLAKLD